jgi:hypothetical protein
MKKLSYLLPLLMMLVLSACDSGGKLRIVNRTQHPLYATVQIDGEQQQIVLMGGQEYTFEVPTETQNMFTGTVEAEVPVWMVGETFQIFDEDNLSYTDSTSVYVPVGKTLSVYADPNRASIKIVNNSSQAMTSAYIIKNNFVIDSTVGVIGELAPGDSVFRCVDYASANNNFYYKINVQMADDSILQFGNEETVLLKDEQLKAVLSDPEAPAKPARSTILNAIESYSRRNK